MTFVLLASTQLTLLVIQKLSIFELGHHSSESLEKSRIHPVSFSRREKNFQRGAYFLFSKVLNIEQG